jgi:hypothetical protein
VSLLLSLLDEDGDKDVSLREASARSIASQITSAVEGRAEHALGHAIALQQLEMRVLEVERAAEIEARDGEEGALEGFDRWSRSSTVQLHDRVDGDA